MYHVEIAGVELKLLPEKAIYIERHSALLVSDVHLGKSETFQARGIPIPNTVNQVTIDRLHQLCHQFQPERLVILGDLFHSRLAMVEEVLNAWSAFTNRIGADVELIVGNHDRPLIPTLKQSSINCVDDAIQFDSLVLSHEPVSQNGSLNICGHIHPCVRIKTKLDNLRLPCFYLEKLQNRLILPSFGEFTGGYEVPLNSSTIAYIVADATVIPFEHQN
jgi:DNA ligase-associated metallophosphoesterase